MNPVEHGTAPWQWLLDDTTFQKDVLGTASRNTAIVWIECNHSNYLMGSKSFPYYHAQYFTKWRVFNFISQIAKKWKAFSCWRSKQSCAAVWAKLSEWDCQQDEHTGKFSFSNSLAACHKSRKLYSPTIRHALLCAGRALANLLCLYFISAGPGNAQINLYWATASWVLNGHLPYVEEK